jgi:hypothetical protein
MSYGAVHFEKVALLTTTQHRTLTNRRKPCEAEQGGSGFTSNSQLRRRRPNRAQRLGRAQRRRGFLWLRTKANPNSWCQEIRKLLGHQEIRESARKSPGNFLISAGDLVYLRLRCSGEPQEEKKITNLCLSDFCWKSQDNLVF